VPYSEPEGLNGQHAFQPQVGPVRTLNQTIGNRTIVAAYRLATIRDTNQMAVIESRRIAVTAVFDDLLRNPPFLHSSV